MKNSAMIDAIFDMIADGDNVDALYEELKESGEIEWYLDGLHPETYEDFVQSICMTAAERRQLEDNIN